MGVCDQPDTPHGEVQGTGDMPILIKALHPTTYEEVWLEYIIHGVALIPDAREPILHKSHLAKMGYSTIDWQCTPTHGERTPILKHRVTKTLIPLYREGTSPLNHLKVKTLCDIKAMGPLEQTKLRLRVNSIKYVTAISVTLAHFRFAHASEEQIKKGVKLKAIRGLAITKFTKSVPGQHGGNSHVPCVACDIGGLIHPPIPKQREFEPSTEPLAILWLDSVGPMKFASGRCRG
jgi:hypothetical protein